MTGRTALQKTECEAYATFHSATLLAQATEAMRELAAGRRDNPTVISALFTAVCVHYCSALERFSLNGISYTPSVRKAEHYDKIADQILRGMRNKVLAHRDHEIHRTRFMMVEGFRAWDGEDGVPILVSTTATAPLDDRVIGKTLRHIESACNYMVSHAVEKLVAYARRWQACGSDTHKRPIIVQMQPDLFLSDEETPAFLGLPLEDLRTVSPIGRPYEDLFLKVHAVLLGNAEEDWTQFLRMSYDVQAGGEAEPPVG